MLSGFKAFILRGNVIELAVAVVIGAAFNAVVQRIVDSLINPIVGQAFDADSLDGALVVALPRGGEIAFGAVIGAIINFVIVAAVVYFVFVLPMNKLRPKVAEAPTGPSDVDLLGEIRDLLRAQAAQEPGASPTAPEGPAAPAAPTTGDPASSDPGATPPPPAHKH
ncbi:large conductance mechanosensitive channel protein MscL [Leucobacter chromiiresistens]|uniref:Large-conductance mechanosensitive channel n=1 Tax=Leucobacter chromiiresistens TaxID=1079994 RepID=A0A147ERB7_9MICO|nr:large conductance mechanosensitive channel protein MscL [Leucobacter chromiiresistens]KTR86963.1 mechanosensitive ion channel protein MscL [Leucobacter chromiiresistens]